MVLLQKYWTAERTFCHRCRLVFGLFNWELFNDNIEVKQKKWQYLMYQGLLDCRERSKQRHNFRRFSKNTRSSRREEPCAGRYYWKPNENAVCWVVSDDYLSAISAHPKMAVVVSITVNYIVLHLLRQTKWSFSFHGRRKTTHIYCFTDFSKPLE